MEPGTELPHEYICQSNCDGQTHYYSFSGDSEGFFEDIIDDNQSQHEVTITIPPISMDEAGSSIIDLSKMSQDAVTIHKTRRLLNKQKLRTGERKVLAILVRDTNGNAPHQSQDKMARDLFGIDGPEKGNNLVCCFTSFRNRFCSGNMFSSLFKLLPLREKGTCHVQGGS